MFAIGSARVRYNSNVIASKCEVPRIAVFLNLDCRSIESDFVVHAPSVAEQADLANGTRTAFTLYRA